MGRPGGLPSGHFFQTPTFCGSVMQLSFFIDGSNIYHSPKPCDTKRSAIISTTPNTSGLISITHIFIPAQKKEGHDEL
jgi:hypothetical protein